MMLLFILPALASLLGLVPVIVLTFSSAVGGVGVSQSLFAIVYILGLVAAFLAAIRRASRRFSLDIPAPS